MSGIKRVWIVLAVYTAVVLGHGIYQYIAYGTEAAVANVLPLLVGPVVVAVGTVCVMASRRGRRRSEAHWAAVGARERAFLRTDAAREDAELARVDYWRKHR